MRVYAEVWPLATIISKAGSGDIDAAELFGTSGDTGHVIQTDIATCRKSIDGTRMILKTTPGVERVSGYACSLEYLTTRSDEEGINYILYSPVPCELEDPEDPCSYVALADDEDWENSALPSVYTRMQSEDWTDPDAQI